MENRRASQIIQQLEEIITRTASVQEKVDMLNCVAWQLRIQEPERTFTFGQQALELSKTCGKDGEAYQQGIAASLVTLSFLDGEAGRLDASLSKAVEALSYIKDQPQPEILINAWYTMGWAYLYAGNYPASLEFGLKSLKTAREIHHKEREAWCLDLVASAFRDPAQSLAMYREAHDIFINMDIVEGQVRILNNWASTLMEAQEYAAGLELAQKGLALAKLWNLKKDLTTIAATIGEILTGMGDYTQAQSSLHDAVALFDGGDRDISAVYVLVELGHVHLKQDNLEHAEQELLKALTVSEQMEMRNEQARCHQYLSEIFERRGRFDKALEHYKTFQALREGIAGEGALKQLAALRVSHQIETAQRDAEIHRLQKEKLQIELDEHKRIHAILEDLATRDPLTNLFNRRHFLNLAEHEWKRAQRYHHPLCALMLDVDHFKQINDQHGHAAGDKALTVVANVLRSALRSTEIAGRYGGDEFVILLPETLPENGLSAARRICQTITEYTISSDVGIIELTSSIGVACATKDNRETTKSLSELLNHADKALYLAKNAGRGQAHLHSEEG